MNINITTGIAKGNVPATATQSAPLPQEKKVEAKVQDQAPAPKDVEITKAPDTEVRRLEMLTKAAKGLANYFVVSDVKFTIYKDSVGQYITKFTNLKDGSITVFPEPEVFEMYTRLTGEDLNLISTKA